MLDSSQNTSYLQLWEDLVKKDDLDDCDYKKILNFMLSYTPQKENRNVVTDRMLETFGSFHNLLNANPLEIMKKTGADKQTAIFISMMPCVCRKYLNSRSVGNNESKKSLKDIYAHFYSLLIGLPYETLYLVCLDSNKRVLKDTKISEGNSRHTPVYLDNILKTALLLNAKYVFIGHNHPNSCPLPSNNDRFITSTIIDVFKSTKIKFLDHIIISGNDYYSFAENSTKTQKLSYKGMEDNE